MTKFQLKAILKSVANEMPCLENTFECSVQVVLLICLLAPPTFETIMEDLDVNVGETPRFAVVVEGKPIPDILWFKVQYGPQSIFITSIFNKNKIHSIFSFAFA